MYRNDLFKMLGLIAIEILVLMVCVNVQASEASFPNRPIRWLSPFAPGGGADITTRAVAGKLSEYVGQPVVVDSRTGASGKIAVEITARARADGYTLMTITPSMVANQDTALFVPITQMTAQFYILVVHPSIPANSVADFVAIAKSKPGSLHYGSSGIETTQHLAGASFGLSTNTVLTHVPYKGGAQAMADLLAGQIQFLFSSVPTAIPQMKAGKIRALAVTSAKRTTLMPELPTVSESGVLGFEVNNWYGVAAPPKTPKSVATYLNTHMVRGLRSPDVRERILADGNEPVGNSPEIFAELIKNTIARWRVAEKAARVKN